ncbi:hypothetical protein GGS23DRAFT_610872 [Durotheca rogersii]|uniref:uncharacterized protein n=1 Tax=Durotheca rogersii TaxID=419775 RepID=UPI002220E69C|nr:uncharacterized protein GGS23DRAFT_610872 [Durotheca rogersii]KAI5862205.1 hypothetical protein GGS23DRAFT_610872 [Durotheca rogersii]
MTRRSSASRRDASRRPSPPESESARRPPHHCHTHRHRHRHHGDDAHDSRADLQYTSMTGDYFPEARRGPGSFDASPDYPASVDLDRDLAYGRPQDATARLATAARPRPHTNFYVEHDYGSAAAAPQPPRLTRAVLAALDERAAPPGGYAAQAYGAGGGGWRRLRGARDDGDDWSTGRLPSRSRTSTPSSSGSWTLVGAPPPPSADGVRWAGVQFAGRLDAAAAAAPARSIPDEDMRDPERGERDAERRRGYHDGADGRDGRGRWS